MGRKLLKLDQAGHNTSSQQRKLVEREVIRKTLLSNRSEVYWNNITGQ
jgi:hypothetical protein